MPFGRRDTLHSVTELEAAVVPWSLPEALAFLDAAKSGPLSRAFVLLLLYGMRRGEVLGLRWISSLLIRSRIRGIRSGPARP